MNELYCLFHFFLNIYQLQNEQLLHIGISERIQILLTLVQMRMYT